MSDENLERWRKRSECYRNWLAPTVSLIAGIGALVAAYLFNTNALERDRFRREVINVEINELEKRRNNLKVEIDALVDNSIALKKQAEILKDISKSDPLIFDRASKLSIDIDDNNRAIKKSSVLISIPAYTKSYNKLYKDWRGNTGDSAGALQPVPDKGDDFEGLQTVPDN